MKNGMAECAESTEVAHIADQILSMKLNSLMVMIARIMPIVISTVKTVMSPEVRILFANIMRTVLLIARVVQYIYQAR